MPLNNAHLPDIFYFKKFNMSEIYITVKQYAVRYGLTEKTVYNHIENGKIPKENIKKVLNTTLIKK